jgi:hypothetical protein
VRLQKIENDAHLEVPVEIGRAIKALAADERHRKAWRFIIDQLCGQRRLSFVPGLPEGRDMMLWREGRRFVGEWLLRIAETPIPDETPSEPPARTLVEKQRRRAKNSVTD